MMQRSIFLKTVMTSGVVVSTGAGLSSCTTEKKEPEEQARIRKAIQAMLSVQRRSWEQGVCAQALLESGEEDLVILMAEEAMLRQDELGRLACVDSVGAVTDPAASGEPVLYAFRKTGDTRYREAAGRMLNYLLHKAPRTKENVLHHITGAPQVWVDSMYMAPPFIAIAGDYEEAIYQTEGMRKYLWDPQAQLFSHIWDEGLQNFARKDFWGVGNGWAVAGMSRVLAALPENMAAEKERIKGYIIESLEGCFRHMRPDGLFHNVLDQKDSFVETNLSQMLAYSVFKGIKGGWLEPSLMQTAEKMRNAAWLKQDRYGMVRDVCGSPNFDRPGAAAEGQAFFILMEAARRMNKA